MQRVPAWFTGFSLLCAACGDEGANVVGPSTNPLAPPVVRFEAGTVAGDAWPTNAGVFSVAVADLDLDGDPDALVNLHHLSRMRLYENTGFGLEQRNRRGADSTGLYENPGVPDLYASEQEIEAALLAAGSPEAIAVWHEPDPTARWRVRVPAGWPHVVRLRSNRPWLVVLGEGEFARESEFVVRVEPNSTEPVDVRLTDLGITTQFVVEAGPGDSILVGPSLAAFVGEASLWKRDPHGIAIGDVAGSLYPEIFVSHGGSIGNLGPPHDPKRDQLFEGLGPWSFEESLAVPASYGRGRQVSLVDVDGDGAAELFVANHETPNALLDDQGSGTFVDRAAELNLDGWPARSFAWIDIDGDRRLDLVHTDGETLSVALNTAAGFADAGPGAFGLELPPVAPSGGGGGGGGSDDHLGGLFLDATLHVADIDRDGELDLLLTEHDSREQLHVYMSRGAGFDRVRDELGVGGSARFRNAIVEDFDGDGWVDILTPCQPPRFWRNDGGTFSAQPLDFGTATNPNTLGAAGDFDLDGRLDLVLVHSGGAFLLWNRTDISSVEAPAVLVPPGPPGTVVRARYADGTTRAQVVGGNRSGRYSQAVAPLWFGAERGVPIVEFETFRPQ